MKQSRTELPHIPALDGARGAGVLGVLFFHAGHLPGGWLGVDLFFVLSGFLITSLLLAEHQQSGRVSILAFWARRARRLIPALFLFLLGVAVYTVVLALPEGLDRIRGDGLATLFYAANWYAIYAGHEYWDLFLVPSPLDHTWSLAIEEQLYLFWPPLLLLLLWLSRGSLRFLAIAAAGLGGLSALWMAWLYDPAEGTARVYFGTDTRASATLLGAALAALLREPVRRWPEVSTPLGDVAAFAGALVLALTWTTLDGNDPRVYRGGLFALALAATAVIAGAVLAPRGLAARLLSNTPLRLLGVVSYGLYLWHWPIFLALTPERVGLDGFALTGVRIAASLAVATLSYRLLERPIRRGALPRGWSGPLLVAGTAVVASAVVLATRPPPGTDRVPDPAGDPELAEGPMDILMIGDSLAQALGPQFSVESRHRGLRVHTLALFGCGALRSPQIRFPNPPIFDLSHCEKIRGRWLDFTATRRPRVVLVVEGWPGAGEREIDGAWLRPCDPAYDAAYRRDLESILRELAALGTEPLVVTAAPPVMEDLSSTFIDLFQEGPDHDLGAMFERRMECQNRVRRQAAGAAGVDVVDLESWVCPGGRCRREVHGQPLRSDGIHFRGRGAIEAASWLLEEILGRP